MDSYHLNSHPGTGAWDRNERKEKARRILAVVSDCVVGDISDLSCLDVGCGCGAITDYMGQHFGQAVGVDMNEKYIQEAVSYATSKCTFFCIANATRMSFRNGTFDVIIANQIYEHVSDAERLMSEIHRILRDEGLCYFAGPNRMQLIEPHRHLPLLHWLPKKLANVFLSAVGDHRPYDVKMMDYWSLRRVIRRRFEIIDYTVPILTEPDRFQVETRIRKPILELVPSKILKGLVCFSPSFIWILRKLRDPR